MPVVLVLLAIGGAVLLVKVIGHEQRLTEQQAAETARRTREEQRRRDEDAMALKRAEQDTSAELQKRQVQYEIDNLNAKLRDRAETYDSARAIFTGTMFRETRPLSELRDDPTLGPEIKRWEEYDRETKRITDRIEELRVKLRGMK